MEIMNQDNNILVSYPTFRKMGVIPKAWPQISKEAFKAWDDSESDVQEESIKVNAIDGEELSEKDKELYQMKERAFHLSLC